MAKKRWIYTQNGHPLPEPIEVTDDWRQPDTGATCTSEAEIYGDLRAPDGTDISSRTKRREYMRRNGVTDASDFAGTWEKAAKEREAFYRGEKINPELRHALGKAEYEASKRRRR